MNNQKLIYLPLWVMLLTLNTYIFGMEENNHPQIIKPKPFKLVIPITNEQILSRLATPITNEQFLFYERILFTIQILSQRPLIESYLKETPPQNLIILDNQSRDLSSNAITQETRCSCLCEDFSSYPTLFTHIKKYHNVAPNKFYCPKPNCRKSFSRPSRVMHHLKDRHQAFKICCQKLLTEEDYVEHMKIPGRHTPTKQRRLRKK